MHAHYKNWWSVYGNPVAVLTTCTLILLHIYLMQSFYGSQSIHATRLPSITRAAEEINGTEYKATGSICFAMIF